MLHKKVKIEMSDNGDSGDDSIRDYYSENTEKSITHERPDPIGPPPQKRYNPLDQDD